MSIRKGHFVVFMKKKMEESFEFEPEFDFSDEVYDSEWYKNEETDCDNSQSERTSCCKSTYR